MNSMESTLHNPALTSGKTNPKAITIAYWIVTALFLLPGDELHRLLRATGPAAGGGGVHTPRLPGRLLPDGALMGQGGGRAGILVPDGSRPAQRVGVRRLRHQPRLGVIAHFSIHDRLVALAPSSITSVLWLLSYYFWRRLRTAHRINRFA